MDSTVSIRELIVSPLATTFTLALLLAGLLFPWLLWPWPTAGAILVVWAARIAVGELLRRRRLKRLLRGSTRRVREISTTDFGVHDWQGDATRPYIPREVEHEVAAALMSRKLVVLCGERMAGKSRSAYEILSRREFANYYVLRPARVARGAGPPLVALLTTRVLSRFRRYILWVDDLGGLLEAGLDPRVVERWLAGGIVGRVALAAITPEALRRVREGASPAGPALERALIISLDSGVAQLSHGEVTRRVERTARYSTGIARAMRVVAVWALLGIREAPTVDTVIELTRKAGGGQCDPSEVEHVCNGPDAPLRLEDDRLVAHPELLTAVEAEDGGRFDDFIVSAFISWFRHRPPELLAIGRALAFRGQYDDAFAALERARDLAREPGLQSEITTALAAVIEANQAPSTERAAARAGFDYREPMGPLQRELTEHLLPDAPDADFDPTSPPDSSAIGIRFYRRGVRRAYIRIAILATADTLAVIAGALTGLSIYASTHGADPSPASSDLVKLVVATVPVVVGSGAWLGLYRSSATRAQLPKLLASSALVALVASAAAAGGGVDLGSLSAILGLYLVTVLVALALRSAYDTVSRRWVYRHRLARRVLILGRREDARACARDIRARDSAPTQILGYISPEATTGDPFAIGIYQDLDQILLALHVDEIVIADRHLPSAEKARLISIAHQLGVDGRFAASDEEVVLGVVGRLEDGDLARAPAALLSAESMELKRQFDRLLINATLFLWGPFLLFSVCHSYCRRRRQPVFVRVDRVGVGGTGFAMLRLRTRRVHEDGTRGAHPHGRFEDFLELSGLDELPQIFNVLRGEMSLVGPRPLPARELADLSRDQRRTLSVRPGITGPWQVAPVTLTESRRRAMDANYLRHWRLVHDVDVLIRTPYVVIRRGFFLSDSRLDVEVRETIRERRLLRWRRIRDAGDDQPAEQTG